MSVYTNKPNEHASDSLAGDILQKKEGANFYLADNRPQAKKTAQLQAKADAVAEPKQIIQKNNTGLPDNLKSGVENMSGYSMDDVKVHYNSNKPAQLQAHAYAQGTEIHLGAGQEKHLQHEAWHVVQQKQGRVKPTAQLMGKVNVNDNEGLEKEATDMGGKALQFVQNPPLQKVTKESPSTPVAQRVIKIKEPEKEYESAEAAIDAAKPVTDGDKEGSIARQRVRNIYKDEEVYLFETEDIYRGDIDRFARNWMAQLSDLGVKESEHDNAFSMHKQLENANPENDNAILHKITYKEVLKAHKRKIGVDQVANKGLEYRPWGGKHTMPLNYSWLASVAHRQVPVQVIVPITDRVLIRPKTRTSTDHPVKTDMGAVKSGEHDAPLSATALEILGLLRNKFYTVDTTVDKGSMLIRLIPTGKVINDPREITAGKSMKYDSLVEELNKYGINIHPNETIERIIAELPAEEMPQTTQAVEGGEDVDIGAMFNRPRPNNLALKWSLAVALFGVVIWAAIQGVNKYIY